jgi:D-aspartate ligase
MRRARAATSAWVPLALSPERARGRGPGGWARPGRPVRSLGDQRSTAHAVVMGDIDLVRPLGLAGIRSALFALPDERGRFSRHVDEVLPWIDHWERREEVVAELLAFAERQAEPPVLYPQSDGDLLVVSRHREELSRACRFVVADAELVEALVDKRRFTELAERHDLPVPPTREVRPGDGTRPADVDLAFPLVAKPPTRHGERWAPIEGAGKASHVTSPGELEQLWPQLAEHGLEVLLQEAVPGPERRIESYHGYVDASGEVAAEFTGRKIRTRPARYGISTAVELTAAPDVAELGREVFRRIGLRGVAKADFKRDDDGALKLLEINPRFTLWHHPAAVAGVNIPAMVHADLTGTPRPPTRPVRPGVTWCDPVNDLRIARAQGMSTAAWVAWAWRCEAVSGLALDDPAPVVRGVLWPPLRRRIAKTSPRLVGRR